MSARQRLLVGASGSIGLLYLPPQLGALRSLDVDLRVVMTPAADAMLPASTLRHLVDVRTDTDQGEGHVALARWADLVMLLPCTANTLGAVATGLAPTLLTTIALAHRHPLLVFPAMNEQMWAAKPVQRNVDALEADGHQVVRPRRTLVHEAATGQVREGIAPPEREDIVRIVAEVLARRRETS